jgi:hypothetical protein
VAVTASKRAENATTRQLDVEVKAATIFELLRHCIASLNMQIHEYRQAMPIM